LLGNTGQQPGQKWLHKHCFVWNSKVDIRVDNGIGGAGRGRKLIGRICLNLIVGWGDDFSFLLSLANFHETLASG